MRLLLALAVLPLPAFAQQVEIPQGCTAYLTVQAMSCRVSHHFTCEDDPEGWQRRIDMDQSGITYFGAIDSETQWVESFHLLSGTTEYLSEEVDRPASFTSLLEEGVSDYDFTTTNDAGEVTRYVGTDRLTGESVEIDGVTLDRTDYDITAFDSEGEILWSSAGNEYISRDWRMFLSGQSTYVSPEGSFESDDSPVAFIEPGEPGFLSPAPIYGCGQEL
ncbi:hypothetical protein [Wenxinia saemankumensis]|uniref:YD repeat-containing protein n=1 Tax=Wenxinia saemankumensis TaxID=1447782 RepID=A0A1M6FRK6_9RHOB|nr:hypothetical protein [Wenxinia saemankumensis]SHJ00305.1 hypothetical protein SAMN05444417_2462 [Wenxinia saemankumensis]